MHLPYFKNMENCAAQFVRKRDDPRRAATQVALIEAAEQLFADVGFEAVSTRQLGTAIGSLNTNVVAYHFGSKEGLIEAVFRHRLPEIDRRRGEMLAEIDKENSAPDVAALLRAFALPLFEQTDASGRHSYASFLIGLERSGRLAMRALVIQDFPETNEIMSRLMALIPAEGQTRLRLVATLLATALQIIDRTPDLSKDAARALYNDALAMSAAALGAPNLREALP